MPESDCWRIEARIGPSCATQNQLDSIALRVGTSARELLQFSLEWAWIASSLAGNLLSLPWWRTRSLRKTDFRRQLACPKYNWERPSDLQSRYLLSLHQPRPHWQEPLPKATQWQRRSISDTCLRCLVRTRLWIWFSNFPNLSSVAFVFGSSEFNPS